MMCLYLANSTTPIVAYLCGILVYIAFTRDWYVTLIIAMLLGCTLYMDVDLQHLFNRQGVRYAMWEDMIDIQFFKERTTPMTIADGRQVNIVTQPRPWKGYGLGNFEKLAMYHHIGWNSHAGQRHREAHNEYLQVIFEMGLIGFIPLLIWLLYLFGHCLLTKNLFGVSVAVISVNCLGHFVFHGVMAFICIVVIGLSLKPCCRDTTQVHK